MAWATCSLPCRKEDTSLALRQLRYFCCSLAGSWSSRLVNRVGDSLALLKDRCLGGPHLPGAPHNLLLDRVGIDNTGHPTHTIDPALIVATRVTLLMPLRFPLAPV